MRKHWLPAAVFLIASAASLNAQTGESIVVLPFFNASRTPNLDWVGESVAENIRETLATQGLMALNREDRQEAFRRLGLRLDAHPTRATILKIGQALDASSVIYGDFEFFPAPAGASGGSRGSLKMTAHVLDMKRMKQGPEFSELGALEDLATAQAHLSWQTLRFLAPKSAPSEAEFRRGYKVIRVDAMESYIRGLIAPNPEQQHKLFSQAIRLEPSFSDPAYQLGLLAYERKDFRTAADWMQKVSTTDVHYRQATFILGICRYNAGDFVASQGAFEKIVTDVPLNEVYNNLGAAQSRRNLPEALSNFQKALEGDSSDPAYHFNVGYALWKQGRLTEAADRFRAVLDRDAADTEARTMLGRCLRGTPAKPAELKEGLERIKTNYEESAYRQLKSLLQADKP